MKFMKKSDAKEAAVVEEDQNKKIKDLSEWVLPNAELLLRKANLTNSTKIIGSVGYASINSFESFSRDLESQERLIPVKRSWGEKPVVVKKVKKEEEVVVRNTKNTLSNSHTKPNKTLANIKDTTKKVLNEPSSLDALWASMNKRENEEDNPRKETKKQRR